MTVDNSYFVPVWQASTAYALTAFVIPSTFTTNTWECTTAGTSGSSEPSWPDISTGTVTVTDGGVTWTRRTGFREALQAGIVSTMTSFQSANPTIIRAIRTVRPLSFTTVELPCFFLGDFTERQSYANGVRTRTFDSMTAYVVDKITEPLESNDRLNFLADVLTEVFTAAYHAAGGYSIVQLAGIADFEFEGGTNVRFPALLLTFAPNTAIAEGRN